MTGIAQQAREMTDAEFQENLGVTRKRLAETEARISFLKDRHTAVREEINELQIDRLKLRRILVLAECDAELESIEAAIEVRERRRQKLN